MRKRVAWAGIAVVAVVALGLVLFYRPTTERFVPLPKLPRGPIEMRVAHVVNERLPRMSDAQLGILLSALQETVRDQFGVQLRFAPIKTLPIARVFSRIPDDKRKVSEAVIYDFKSGRGDRARLAEDFGRGFKDSGESLAGLVAFTTSHVGPLKENTFEELGAVLSALQLERIERWKGITALDGKPAIDDTPYNEFMHWEKSGHADLPFELVLTNQIIASVEHILPAVHGAVRGGYANGVTTYGKSARFKTISIWSTFAFAANDDWAIQTREGEKYEPDEAARLAGIGAAHEIGHQLFHLLHPYGQEACVMNPVPMFAYRKWAEKLSGKDCPMGSNPAMQPGAAKIRY